MDTGNGAEVNYNLGGKSCRHYWSPKLIFWLYNIALNNTYKMYTALVKEHTGVTMREERQQGKRRFKKKPVISEKL
jgi:hypothetical protein